MRKSIVLLFFSFSVLSGFAQKELNHQNEMGFHFGGVTYIGDLNPKIDLSNISLSGQIFFRKNFLNNVSSVRLNLLVGTLQADEGSIDLPLPTARQLAFSNTFTEISLLYEYNFMDFRNMVHDVRFSPYVFGGLGATILVGESNNAFVTMPFGLGIKYAIGKKTNLNVEYGARKVFSDKVDGYDSDEELSSSTPNDWYHFLGVGFSYTFYRQDCPVYSPNN